MYAEPRVANCSPRDTFSFLFFLYLLGRGVWGYTY